MNALPPALDGALRALEHERTSRIPPKALVAIVGIVFGMAILATFAAQVPILPWILVAGAAVFFAWVSSTRSAVAQSFKQRVLPPLARAIHPGLAYSVGGMPEEEFRFYGLYEAHDRYFTQDLISGTAGRTAVRFAMVHAQKEVGSGKNKRYEDLFKGMLFVAQFNKRVQGTTRVACGEAGFLEELSRGHVELENPEFDDLFRVQSTDQVEARYILTPEMQERFVALRREFDRFTAAFFDDKVVIALELDYDFLDPDVDASFGLEQVQRLFYRLKLLAGIVDALDLNTRLWTVK
jgi:hypothetical protein